MIYDILILCDVITWYIKYYYKCEISILQNYMSCYWLIYYLLFIFIITISFLLLLLYHSSFSILLNCLYLDPWAFTFFFPVLSAVPLYVWGSKRMSVCCLATHQVKQRKYRNIDVTSTSLLEGVCQMLQSHRCCRELRPMPNLR